MRKIVLAALLAFGHAMAVSPGNAANCPPSTVQYVFTSGTTAVAAEVNANFAGLLTCANSYLAPSASPFFSGNVGIGTTVPLKPLSINYVQNATDESGAAISLGSTNTGSTYAYISPSQSNNSVTFAGVRSGIGNDVKFLINPNGGFVGIGTTAPMGELHVNGVNHSSGSDVYNVYVNTTTTQAAGVGGSLSLGGAYTGATQTAFASISGRKENGTAGDYAGYLSVAVRAGGSGGPTEALRIASTGNVGIGTVSPGKPLDVVGDIRTSTCVIFSTGSSGTCASDAGLKRDVTPFVLGLQTVVGLKPVYFYYNGLGGNPDDGVQQLGLIAQDVEVVAPELVGTRLMKLHPSDRAPTKVKTVNYVALTYMLINAVRELKIANDNYAAQLASLHKQVAELEALAGTRTARLSVSSTR